MLLPRLRRAEQLNGAYFIVVGGLFHLGIFLLFPSQDAIATLRCVTAATSTIPTRARIQIGVIPPATAAGRVADRKQTVHLVLVNRRRRPLRRNTRLFVIGPVLLDVLVDPPVQNGIDILPFVIEMGQPDVVVEAGRLPRHLFGIETNRARDAVNAVVPVAQTTHLDVGLTAH